MFEVKYIHNYIKLHEIIYERNYVGTNQLAPRFKIHNFFIYKKLTAKPWVCNKQSNSVNLLWLFADKSYYSKSRPVAMVMGSIIVD